MRKSTSISSIGLLQFRSALGLDHETFYRVTETELENESYAQSKEREAFLWLALDWCGVGMVLNAISPLLPSKSHYIKSIVQSVIFALLIYFLHLFINVLWTCLVLISASM